MTKRAVVNRARESRRMKAWRAAVLERDEHSCRECGSTVDVTAHHVFKLADFPEVAFDINNGKSLCPECHKATDNYGRRGGRKDTPTAEEASRIFGEGSKSLKTGKAPKKRKGKK